MLILYKVSCGRVIDLDNTLKLLIFKIEDKGWFWRSFIVVSESGNKLISIEVTNTSLACMCEIL